MTREKLLNVIARESDRLASIVNDILWASRLDADTMHLTIQSCDADELARSVIDAAEVHRPETSSSPSSSAATCRRSPETRTRSGRCSATWSTTRSSTRRKAAPSPSSSREEPRSSGSSSTTRGSGFRPAEQQRIFEKFYRLDPNLTEGVGGTGLGLYICRELVRRMDGRIWVVSPRPDGRGSTFCFELPAAETGRP